MRSVLPALQGEDPPDAARAVLDEHLSYIAGELGKGPLLCGTDLTLADIRMSYILALLDRFDLLEDHRTVAAYWRALRKQPGYIAAVEAAGPMAPPA